MSAARAALEALFRTGLAAVDPARRVRAAIERQGGAVRVAGIELAAPCTVLAAGKAAVRMAGAFESEAGDRVGAGLVVTRDPDPTPLRRFAVQVAGHPLPDARSEAAGHAALALAAGVDPASTLVVLLSGGASALLACPVDGVSLGALRETTAALLTAGADIGELNCVRKHLTRVSGGRLAAATPARHVVVLAVSDVLGDDWATIGSGPCAADPSRFEDALAILEHRALLERVPASVRAHLEAGRAGRREESVKPGDPRLERVRAHLLARNRDALAAIHEAARAQGLAAYPVTDRLRGEAREAGRRLAVLARSLPVGPPRLLLAGGEPTVTVRGGGKGGRAQELALAAALELVGDTRVALLAAGTDGSDGPTPAAGAYVDGGTVARAAALGVDATRALADNDAYGCFTREGGVFTTGPTGTNVMDLVLVRVDGAEVG